MKMGRQRTALFALCCAACAPSTGSVVGRWQRTDQPAEWVEFAEDGRFTARSFTDTILVRGTYQQSGTTVLGTSTLGFHQRLELRDSLLVMQDGTKFRRAANDTAVPSSSDRTPKLR